MEKIVNIRRIIVLILISTIIMSFSTCPNDSQNKARVFFIYERSFWGNEVQILINSNQKITLPNNKYLIVDIEPSNITIAVERNGRFSETIQANLTLEPNQIYYLKIYREVDYFTDKLYLVRVSEQTAKKAMKSMKLEKFPMDNE